MTYKNTKIKTKTSKRNREKYKTKKTYANHNTKRSRPYGRLQSEYVNTLFHYLILRNFTGPFEADIPEFT